MNKANEKNYELNNSKVEVSLNRFSKVEVNSLFKASEYHLERREKGQYLLNYLCDKFKIPRVNLSVLNVAQPHSTNNKGTLSSVKKGDYNPNNFNVRVWNLTAVRKKPISIKSFLEVILHEFMHHYDMQHLKFSESPHTSGFYKRLSDLQRKLM